MKKIPEQIKRGVQDEGEVSAFGRDLKEAEQGLEELVRVERGGNRNSSKQLALKRDTQNQIATRVYKIKGSFLKRRLT